MNFQRGRHNDEPEINLVPMIDVLLVILIFLVVTTTYSKFAELEITLPQTNAEQVDQNTEKPDRVDITVNALGEYTINLMPIKSGASIEGLRDALLAAANQREDPFVVINADAKATHQSVITIMEAARLAGYNKITFATETDKINKQ
ncbi:MAG: biopolymer transporter ExbD [Nitrosomonas sp.]|nr:MAG: biopolymer transporter ExbD [Nitrosomonas sp.]